MATSPHHDTGSTGKKRTTLLWLTAGVMLVTFLYLSVRTFIVFSAGYSPLDRFFSVLLLLAEAFVLLHGMAYFTNVLRVLRNPPPPIKPYEEIELSGIPPVAIVVAAYKEPLEVVEQNLICFRNLTYPNKHIYLLDDTRYELDAAGKLTAYRASLDAICRKVGVNLFRRNWHGAKAGIINDFLWFLEGHPLEGSHLEKHQRHSLPGTEKYIAIFDAAMNPLPDFVEPLVEALEKDERLGFVQTPQYYTNFEDNPVAHAAGMQQVIFYEFICEGKSSQDAMFCCGTNVMFRRSALVDVGGLDETSVTEDFATSIKLHLKGWHSLYLNRISSFGMGPNDLGGYFKQQFRWSLGTVGMLREIICRFVEAPRALPMVKWLEYGISSTYYFVGWVFLIMFVCPLIYIFFGVPAFFAHPWLFLLVFAPYLTLTMLAFLVTLAERNYRMREIFVALVLTQLTFPVYIKATSQAVVGIKGGFGITPKAGSTALPLKTLWPHILSITAAVAALAWGANRIYYGDGPVEALVVNMFWAAYQGTLLCSIFWFNRPSAS